MVYHFVAKYHKKACGDLNEVASDNDGVIDDDDDDTNSKDLGVAEIGIKMLDMLVHLKYLSKAERNFLFAIKFKLEKMKVLNKKQSPLVIILC